MDSRSFESVRTVSWPVLPVAPMMRMVGAMVGRDCEEEGKDWFSN